MFAILRGHLKLSCICYRIPRGTLVGQQCTVHLKNRLWITKDWQMQSKNRRPLDTRNFNKTDNASCAWWLTRWLLMAINRLTANDPYTGRTAPLTSKRCISYIYSTNVSTEYFKHALYSPFSFSSKCSLFHNANLFGSCIIHILYTGCAKIKKIIPAPKG
jgi:hypothetical protein